MIFITGDTHIPSDIHKLNTAEFPVQKVLTKQDYVIIAGDFGGVWDKVQSREEKYWLDWLSAKNFTTLFVDGNHENYDRLDAYPVTNKFNGKVQEIAPDIYHLMRGEVYTIDNYKIFTMGGAPSHDIWHRVEHKSWWQRELPDEQDYANAIKNLAANNNKVDYIITHCPAPEALKTLFAGYNVFDFPITYPEHRLASYKFASWLTEISQTVKFKNWFHGHMHKDTPLSRKHIGVYNTIVCLNVLDNMNKSSLSKSVIELSQDYVAEESAMLKKRGNTL